MKTTLLRGNRRKCLECKKIKHANYFGKNRSYCIPCNTKRFKKWTKENIRHVRSHRLQKDVGITLDQKEALIKEQNNKCAICEQPFTETPCVDHCHKRGYVRGVLCRGCNTGLGGFRDSIKILSSAIMYLSQTHITRLKVDQITKQGVMI